MSLSAGLSVILQPSKLCADHGLSSNFQTLCSSKGACLGPILKGACLGPFQLSKLSALTKGLVLMFMPLVSVFWSGGGMFLRGLSLPGLPLIRCNLHYENVQALFLSAKRKLLDLEHWDAFLRKRQIRPTLPRLMSFTNPFRGCEWFNLN
jgi:hypothetical protein